MAEPIVLRESLKNIKILTISGVRGEGLAAMFETAQEQNQSGTLTVANLRQNKWQILLSFGKSKKT